MRLKEKIPVYPIHMVYVMYAEDNIVLLPCNFNPFIT